MPRSAAEELFAAHARAAKLTLVREYVFAPPRRYRADFAAPERKLLIEIEGGAWINGRHNRGSGFTADCAKYNLAASLGFRVLRFTPAMVRSGEALRLVEQLLRDAA